MWHRGLAERGGEFELTTQFSPEMNFVNSQSVVKCAKIIKIIYRLQLSSDTHVVDKIEWKPYTAAYKTAHTPST